MECAKDSKMMYPCEVDESAFSSIICTDSHSETARHCKLSFPIPAGSCFDDLCVAEGPKLLS